MDKVALVVAGQPWTPPHAGWYYEAVASMASLARSWGFQTHLLFPEPRPGVDGPSTRANITESLGGFASLSTNSLLLLYVVGHGHFDGRQSWFLAADGFMSASDFSALLAPLPMGRMVLCFTPCQSGEFIGALAGQGRVVITSTLAQEDNRASFAEALRDGFASTSTVGEAFDFATGKVAEWYRRHGIAAVAEHPQISDRARAESMQLR